MAGTQKPRGKVVDLRGRLGLAPLLDELVAIFAQTDRDLGDASAALQRGIGNFGSVRCLHDLVTGVLKDRRQRQSDVFAIVNYQNSSHTYLCVPAILRHAGLERHVVSPTNRKKQGTYGPFWSGNLSRWAL